MGSKRHEKRFIIEVFGSITRKWRRSGNTGLVQAFHTREAAQIALDTPGHANYGLKYRVRQK